jgi:hypothetical protein
VEGLPAFLQEGRELSRMAECTRRPDLLVCLVPVNSLDIPRRIRLVVSPSAGGPERLRRQRSNGTEFTRKLWEKLVVVDAPATH